MNVTPGSQPEEVRVELTVEIAGVDQLSGILGRLQSIPKVTEARCVR